MPDIVTWRDQVGGTMKFRNRCLACLPAGTVRLSAMPSHWLFECAMSMQIRNAGRAFRD